ncbi:MAG TPA: hypothetical protein VJ842_00745 [Pyrinomonadaceae bacterium]|nr:hypothetical protein [Pyrinomonadaceae bacterium]
MRRKLGILILVCVTVLAGTQEAARQFDGLKSSLTELTRASLWSGLIVYAQPVTDGKLPSPQIYYLMPRAPQQQQPASPNAQPEAVLADNNNAAKPEAKNNHGAEVADAVSTDILAAALPLTREIEDAAKSEFVLLPQHVAVAANAAPKLEKARVYEEVARNEAVARRFKHDADVLVKAFVKDKSFVKHFDAAKLEAQTERLIAAQEQIETLKLKALGDAERLNGQIEFKFLRRPARAEQIERVKAISSLTETEETALPALPSVACEKTINTQEGLAEAPVPAPLVPAAPVAPVATVNTLTATATTSVQVSSEPVVGSEGAAVMSLMGNSWALDCDTEPEYK